jgi:hypothetical protein
LSLCFGTWTDALIAKTTALLTRIAQLGRLSDIESLVTEASNTARPFFERLGFVTLEEKVVEFRSIPIANYRVARTLSQAASPGRLTRAHSLFE